MARHCPAARAGPRSQRARPMLPDLQAAVGFRHPGATRATPAGRIRCQAPMGFVHRFVHSPRIFRHERGPALLRQRYVHHRPRRTLLVRSAMGRREDGLGAVEDLRPRAGQCGAAGAPRGCAAGLTRAVWPRGARLSDRVARSWPAAWMALRRPDGGLQTQPWRHRLVSRSSRQAIRRTLPLKTASISTHSIRAVAGTLPGLLPRLRPRSS